MSPPGFEPHKEKGGTHRACAQSVAASFHSSAEVQREFSRRQSQDRAPPVWYSMTRVSKKFFSFLRSIISAIHGKGLLAPS